MIFRLLLLSLLLAPPTRAAGLDACRLLDSADIRSVQREPVQRVDRSTGSVQELVATQCYFALTTPANSVSLAVIEPGPAAQPKALATYWKETFGDGDRDRDHDHDRKPGEETEEHVAPPVPVQGLGVPAFWSGSAVGGSLYALRKNRILRISVGGRGTSAEKRDRCRRLARVALRRMRN